MLRYIADVFRCRAGFLSFALAAAPSLATPAAAQEWNDARVTALVTRATELRARQLADTGLTDYTATALGSLTFLAQVGEGFPDPPKVVKADQIALEVYWRAPNQSKQLILGRRDTLLLPTDIAYHRDHLGIVQNNFPEIIRLGDGDEVRDVPHPLSAAGLRTYDYSISDSLRIEVPGQVIEVYEVRIRPKNDRVAAAVGAIYLSRADAQVVRMAFSFTRAALLDQQLEDVAIVLDNALIEERFWLPRRQEIEIRRSGTWLDFPARGIIRGGFEVCCYRINAGTPATVRFTGPEIDLAPPNRRAAYRFEEPLSAIVPDNLSTASSEELARVQSRAAELVSQAALARARSGAVLARSVSDLVRVNRAEGLSLGAGVRRSLTPSVDLALSGRYGFSDERVKGAARLTYRASPRRLLSVGAFDELRDASDLAESSGMRNSIAAQEFGVDFTEPYRVRGFDVRAEYRIGSSLVASVTVSREQNDSARLAATPARGTYRPLIAVPSQKHWRSGYGVALVSQALLGGVVDGDVSVQVRNVTDVDGAGVQSRVTSRIQYQHAVGPGAIVASTFAGITDSELPQDQIRAGGPVTAPGYSAHAFASRALVSQRVEWRVPVPFPAIPIGRWGHSPGRATFAPYAGLVVLEQRDGGADGNRAVFGYPSLGGALLVFFDLIRFDVARGIRNGRWTFGVDLTRDLWRIL